MKTFEIGVFWKFSRNKISRKFVAEPLVDFTYEKHGLRLHSFRRPSFLDQLTECFDMETTFFQVHSTNGAVIALLVCFFPNFLEFYFERNPRESPFRDQLTDFVLKQILFQAHVTLSIMFWIPDL